jgi:hypothetical protein
MDWTLAIVTLHCKSAFLELLQRQCVIGIPMLWNIKYKLKRENHKMI